MQSGKQEQQYQQQQQQQQYQKPSPKQQRQSNQPPPLLDLRLKIARTELHFRDSGGLVFSLDGLEIVVMRKEMLIASIGIDGVKVKKFENFVFDF